MKTVNDEELLGFFKRVNNVAVRYGINLVLPQELSDDERERLAKDPDINERVERASGSRGIKSEYPELSKNLEFFARKTISEHAENYYSARVARSILDERGYLCCDLPFSDREKMIGKIYYFANLLGMIGDIAEFPPESIKESTINKLSKACEKLIKKRTRGKDEMEDPAITGENVRNTRIEFGQMFEAVPKKIKDILPKKNNRREDTR